MKKRIVLLFSLEKRNVYMMSRSECFCNFALFNAGIRRECMFENESDELKGKKRWVREFGNIGRVGQFGQVRRVGQVGDKAEK